jgi:hypothetical protein
MPNWAVIVGWGIAALIAFCTLNAIRRQANIAADALALSQRPRIKVQAFAVNDDVFEPREEGRFTIDVKYKVVNFGGTDAIITDSNCTILLRHINEASDLSALPPYDITVANQITERGTVLRGGEARRFTVTHSVLPEREVEFGLGHLHIYAIGYLIYRGNVGPQYRTGFCRRLEREGFTPTGFSVVPNPNYEYQD